MATKTLSDRIKQIRRLESRTTIIPQQRRTRAYAGVDWGAAPRVLATVDDRELWWLPGSMGWDGRGQPSRYYSGSLKVFEWRGPMEYSGCGHDLHRGGRLSKKLLQAKAREIDVHMCCSGLAGVLDPKATICVGRMKENRG